jgi:putative hydrolase of the HAD superfamily
VISALAPPTALLIDFDGVLRRWDSEDSLIEEAHGLPAGAILGVALSPAVLLPAICGSITDEAWRRNVADELLRLYPGSASANAVARWSESIGEVDLGVAEVLSRCRRDLRVVLATNATSRLASDLRALGLTERFQGIASSSRIGFAKPDEEFYAAALQIAGVFAADAIFVDDSASNVAAAARLGIRSHHFSGHIGLEQFLLEVGAIQENTP